MKKPWLKQYDRDVPLSLTYPETTVHAFLQKAAQKFPDRHCTVYQDKALSYAAMDTLSDRFAAVLQGHGDTKRRTDRGDLAKYPAVCVGVLWHS